MYMFYLVVKEKKLDEDYIEVEGLASIEEDSTLKTSFGIIA